MSEAEQQKMLSFLGLCVKAGNMTTGQEACVAELRGGTAVLALLDAAASANTRKRVLDAAVIHQTPVYEISEGLLGSAIGKAGRMVLTMAKGKMAARIETYLKDEQPINHSTLTSHTTDAGVQAQQ